MYFTVCEEKLCRAAVFNDWWRPGIKVPHTCRLPTGQIQVNIVHYTLDNNQITKLIAISYKLYISTVSDLVKNKLQFAFFDTVLSRVHV